MTREWAVVTTTAKVDLLEFLAHYASSAERSTLRFAAEEIARDVGVELVDYESWEEVE